MKAKNKQQNKNKMGEVPGPSIIEQFFLHLEKNKRET
jgi:hypothetical protein